ncbi:MAG: leucine/isoleucine/valine transporter permease subunit [Chloroflexi bacterium]|nr:leucine/isoleucine/valine transporter permease subunit [Chloroflexota bacterium]
MTPNKSQTNLIVNALSSGAKLGAIGGLVAISIALQGMMQAFSARDIIHGVVTMSQSLLIMTFFFTAYFAGSRHREKGPISVLMASTLAGGISSAFLDLLVWVGSILPLGEVFIAATKQMYDLLLFKMDAVSGGIFLIVLGAVCGFVAGLLVLLPIKARNAILGGLVAVFGFGLLEDLVKTTLSDWPALRPITDFLYVSNGLTNIGAIALFVLFAVAIFSRSMWEKQLQARYAALPSPTRTGARWSGIVLGSVLLLLAPIFLGLYISDVLDSVGLYLLMGLGLNIVVGFAGLLDLGYVAFYAIGAYTVGILTSPEHATGVIHNWWLAFPFGVLAAVVAGVLLGIPVLRMRGDYLAIVTLGFGEIVRLLALSDFLKPWEGGAQGIQGIPTPDIGPIRFVQQQINLPLLGQIQFTPSQMFYYLFLAGCLLAIFISSRVKVSRLGRAWMAMREDEDVAQAMGIDLVATKLMAFGMGAAFGGLAGTIFASKLQSVYPTSFSFLVSIYVLALIIIGGMGNIPGVIFGALMIYGLPELLREVGDYRYLFFGIGLVIMMLVRPEGILPEARRRMELEEFREEQVPLEKDTVVMKTMGQP